MNRILSTKGLQYLLSFWNEYGWPQDEAVQRRDTAIAMPCTTIFRVPSLHPILPVEDCTHSDMAGDLAFPPGSPHGTVEDN